MKLKLDSVQKHKINQSFNQLSEVLHEVKTKRLIGHALSDMKELEKAVQIIECLKNTY